MNIYHRLTANGIETMSDTPVYTFECKACGARCQTADGAYDHYRQHAVDSTFTKTLTGATSSNLDVIAAAKTLLLALNEVYITGNDSQVRSAKVKLREAIEKTEHPE